ncbi:MAG: hypothetical protein V4598_13305 [Bdellovibrionota bacterium]
MKKVLLGFCSFLFFVFLVEGFSFILIKMGRRAYWESGYSPGEIWTHQHAQDLAKRSDRIGAISRLILKKSYDQNKSQSSISQNELRLETPVYENSDKGRSMYLGPWRLNPNLDENFQVLGTKSSRVKYKVHYSTDEYGNRKGHVVPDSKEGVLFLGCSFTFGQGVNDEETFPFQFGKRTGLNTYNLGVPGSSPSTILKSLEEEKVNFPDKLKKEVTTVVLTIIPDHLQRVVGTSSFFGTSESNYTYYPYYYLEKGNLVSVPSFAEGGLDKNLTRLLSYSNLMTVSGAEYPVMGDEHYELFSRLVQKIQSHLRSKLNVKEFIVAIFPTGRSYSQLQKMKTTLIRDGMKVLDYSFIQAPFLMGDSYYLAYDGHPSPKTYDLFTDLLVLDLTGKSL